MPIQARANERESLERLARPCARLYQVSARPAWPLLRQSRPVRKAYSAFWGSRRAAACTKEIAVFGSLFSSAQRETRSAVEARSSTGILCPCLRTSERIISCGRRASSISARISSSNTLLCARAEKGLPFSEPDSLDHKARSRTALKRNTLTGLPTSATIRKPSNGSPALRSAGGGVWGRPGRGCSRELRLGISGSDRLRWPYFPHGPSTA